MSSAVFSTSAAPGRPFLFDDDPESRGGPFAALARTENVASNAGETRKPAGKQAAEFIRSTLGNRHSAIPLTSASRLQIRPMPEMASTGVAALDSLTGGLPRGCLTEICGPVSSGRTSVMLAALAAATRRGEFCALIDASDALDPQSTAAAGIDLDRFLWVRCGQTSSPRQGTEKNSFEKRTYGAGSQNAIYQSEHRLEQVLRATDLLLESGGFGLIVLDLADVSPQAARRIPLTTWFRFRRAVEHKPTILLALEQQPIAGSCSSLWLNLQAAKRGNAGLKGAERRKNAAHACPERSRRGASRGLPAENEQAPERRKKIPPQLEINPAAPIPSAAATLHPAELAHANLLHGLEIKIELIRSRLDRKPSHSVTFETTTAWTA